MKKLFTHFLILLSLFGVIFLSNGFIGINKVSAAECTSFEKDSGKINTSTGCACPPNKSIGQDTSGKCKPIIHTDETCTIAQASQGLCTNGATKASAQQAYDDNDSFWIKNVIRPLFKIAAFTAMKFFSFLLGVSGVLLNHVLNLTVVQMAHNFNEGGLGEAINSSWTTVRDVANMSFIFVLLYASIQLILGIKSSSDVRGLIVKIVIAALLINFSLFFTKVVIDASNVVALTFYEAISPGATSATVNATDLFQTGLSNSLMQPLNLASLTKMTDGGLITTGGIITLGIMGSLMLLVATFIFLVISVLFIIRYVILIFVLILSPLAIIADVVPGIKTYFNQWKTALINQAFFPAVYFFLTWITIKLLRGMVATLMPDGTLPPTGTALHGAVDAGASTVNYAGIGTVMVNFSIVIAFLIASLIISKKMASQAAPGVDGAVKWATGMAGKASFGFAGGVARNTLGRAAQAVAESERLRDADSAGGAKGMAARLALWSGRKTASQSFDVKGTAIGGLLGAGKAQKGGYAQTVKDREKAAEEREKRLKPTDRVVADAERIRNIAKAEHERTINKYGENSKEAKNAEAKLDSAQGRVDKLKGNKDKIKENVAEIEKNIEKKRKESVERKEAEEELDEHKSNRKSVQDTVNKLQVEVNSAVGNEKDAKAAQLASARELLNQSSQKVKEAQQRINEIDKDFNDKKEALIKEEKKKEVKSTIHEDRKEQAAKSAENSIRSRAVGAVLGNDDSGIAGKLRGTLRRSLTTADLTTAAQMRKSKKSVKDELEKLLKDNGDIQEPKKDEPEAASGGSASTSGTDGTTPSAP